MTNEEQKIIDDFHNLYHLGPADDGSIYKRTTWMGTPCFKCPMDMWIYQEILYEVKPDLIIETGTYKGGSALYLAHLCDALSFGKIVSIDIDVHIRPPHPRIEYVTGSSDDTQLAEKIFAQHPEAKKIMVILDSDHSEAHVARELEVFSKYVSINSYLIVEDSNLNGHPTYASHGPGPFEAIEKFLVTHPDFISDKSRERFLMTFNPTGFLKRTR
jgi:cephalosporin hydroxylase